MSLVMHTSTPHFLHDERREINRQIQFIGLKVYTIKILTVVCPLF